MTSAEWATRATRALDKLLLEHPKAFKKTEVKRIRTFISWVTQWALVDVDDPSSWEDAVRPAVKKLNDFCWTERIPITLGMVVYDFLATCKDDAQAMEVAQ